MGLTVKQKENILRGLAGNEKHQENLLVSLLASLHVCREEAIITDSQGNDIYNRAIVGFEYITSKKGEE